ncbi:MAG: nuclear transport factor 2 family protein [Cytophagales bacterium]|nr:nuclear transport factor 2 family protein [Cytophagales bacterium]
MTAKQTVEAYYTCFNKKDKQGMLAFVSEDIRHEPNQGIPRLGKELFTEFLDKMDECYEEVLTDLEYFESSNPDKMAVEFIVHGKYKKAEAGLPPAHGQTYILPAGAFLEVRNGLVSRVTTYYNLELWLSLVS